MITMMTTMLTDVPVAALAPIAFGAALAGALVWGQRTVRRALDRIAAGAVVTTTVRQRPDPAAADAIEFDEAA